MCYENLIVARPDGLASPVIEIFNNLGASQRFDLREYGFIGNI